ncbi:MAG: FGGY-family carbohydrate kinase [Spirochaetaceae bacterium]|jgi:sugar (pentulose or hexulose) kinase|nr:FGGY-family carbohydrate kinase [Spirochaetaceae bacterium]
MGEPVVLTFDMGTQSARALLVNSQGIIVHKVQKIYAAPYYSKQPGWAEQRPDFYWDSLCEVSRSLKEQAGSIWQDISAVTCATIRDTCLCLDREYNPLRDVILWLDDRKTENLDPLPVLWDILIKVAGMSEGVALQRRISAGNWLARNEKEIWERTDKFVFISTWLNYKFCGNLVDSSASVIGHIPFESRTRTWMKSWDMRWFIFGIRPNQLFDLVEPGTVMGTITRKTAEETGITAGLPLIATGSDKGCETLGLSCISEEKAALSFGTTATVQLSTWHYLEPLPYMPPYPGVISGCYNPEIEIFRGYWLLSWFKREFAAKETAEAQRLGILAEELLDDRLKEIKAGCDGLIMQPYFTPGIDMPFAKGAIIGFSDIHTRIHVYRAIIEGINFALMDGLRGMEKRGKLKVKELYVAGGGSQSAEICRITASMFGLPVYRTQTHEVTGIGSSLTAFVAQGVFSSYEEGIKAMVHIKDEFMPVPPEHEIYEKLYQEVFKKVFDRLSPLYEEINRIIGKTVPKR